MEDAGALSICADLVFFTNLKKERFHGDDLAMIVRIGGLGIILPNFKSSKKRKRYTQGTKEALSETLKKRKRYTQGTKEALSEMSKVFLTLLSNVCNGIDRSIGSPADEEFWTRCAEKMKTLSTTNHELSNHEFTAQTCIREFKSLRNVYFEIKRPSPKEKYRKLALTDYMPLLEEVYGRHYGKFSCLDYTHGVPESPPPASESLKRTDTDSTRLHSIHRSSGSSLELEVEMGVQVALKGLLEDDMLVLKDVAHAEAYLNRSTWASSLFLQEEDSKKRADMIIKSRKQDEEVEMRRRRILEEEEMKRRRMF